MPPCANSGQYLATGESKSNFPCSTNCKRQIAAMPFVDNAILLIIGFGKVEEELKELAQKSGLENRVIFYGKVPFEDLLSYTKQADVGLLLERPLGLSFTYSLPNKLFDYIHAELPILASPLVEVKRIIEQYNVGEIIDDYSPEHIAQKLNEMLSNSEKREVWKGNMQKAKKELNWEIEQKKLVEIYSQFL